MGEIKQGGCPEGWKDGAEVGLGCVVADLSDPNLSEPDAETACEALAEGAHLVEIFSEEQMHFLQNYLAMTENESLGDLFGYVFWWIGLNDIESEGNFKWPISEPPLTSPTGMLTTESPTPTPSTNGTVLRCSLPSTGPSSG